MTYRIKATYRKTGNRVIASTRKFKTKADAKEYAKEVVGKKRFKGFRYEKVKTK